MTMNNKKAKRKTTKNWRLLVATSSVILVYYVSTEINNWGLRIELRSWCLFCLPHTWLWFASPATHPSLKIDVMQCIGGKEATSHNIRVIKETKFHLVCRWLKLKNKNKMAIVEHTIIVNNELFKCEEWSFGGGLYHALQNC